MMTNSIPPELRSECCLIQSHALGGRLDHTGSPLVRFKKDLCWILVWLMSYLKSLRELYCCQPPGGDLTGSAPVLSFSPLNPGRTCVVSLSCLRLMLTP